MSQRFLVDPIEDSTYAAFYRFMETALTHADMSEEESPEGNLTLSLKETLTVSREGITSIQWPNPQEEASMDSSYESIVMEQQRIVQAITAGHEIFEVDTLFVDDKGNDALARDAARGKYLLHQALQSEAIIDFNALDENEDPGDAPYARLTLTVMLPATDEQIDTFHEGSIGIGDLIDAATHQESP